MTEQIQNLKKFRFIPEITLGNVLQLLSIAAAVIAGAHKDYATAQRKMTGLKSVVYKPNAKAHATYKELYALYKQLHDAFGTQSGGGNLYGVMKKLIEIRGRVRK